MENRKPRRYRLYDWLYEWEHALNGELYVFGYHGLRLGFAEAFARALNLRNGRLIYEIARVDNTTKPCQCAKFRSIYSGCLILKCKYATLDYLDDTLCKCKNKPSYALVVKKGYKFYRIYLCEHHMKLLVASARILMNTVINSIFMNMYEELFDEKLVTEDEPSRTLSYVESLREGEKQ